MTVRAPVTITLGGRDFAIRPLTFGQVEAIDGVLADRSLAMVRQGLRVIAVGLRRDHGEAAAGIEDMEGEVGEVSRAMSAVLRQGGFLPAEPGDAKSGEASAAAPNAPTGAPFADA